MYQVAVASRLSWAVCRLSLSALKRLRAAYACRSGLLVSSTMNALHTSSLTYPPAWVITWNPCR